jgi:hypothetical protein
MSNAVDADKTTETPDQKTEQSGDSEKELTPEELESVTGGLKQINNPKYNDFGVT